MVNDPTSFRVDWMPFAGRRVSGYGTGGIPYTMHDMTQDKMILLKRPEVPPPRQPSRLRAPCDKNISDFSSLSSF